MKRWQELALAWTIAALLVVGLALAAAEQLGFPLPLITLPTRW